tara:strand:- start:850 stop:1002 length:153 start_codon:yes stop_codon:yes gene_type:complete
MNFILFDLQEGQRVCSKNVKEVFFEFSGIYLRIVFTISFKVIKLTGNYTH